MTDMPRTSGDLPGRPADRPLVWPSVIGVLTIVMAVDALAKSSSECVWTAWSYRKAVFGGGSSLTSAFPPLEIACRSAYVGGNLLAILAGVLLLCRRRATAILYRMYAVTAVLAAALHVWSYYTITHPDIGTSDPYMADMAGVYLLAAGARVLIGVAYPIFAFVWFCRGSVRSRVRSWRAATGRLRARPAGPVWPSVLGVLSMVMGATGLLHSLVPLTVNVLQMPLTRLDGVEWSGVWSGLSAAGALVSVTLVVSGWLLVGRRRGAVACALGYAICAYLFVAVCAFSDALFSWSHRRQWGLPPGDIGVLVARSTLWELWSLVFPVFLIAWFTRPTVRAQIASWRVDKAPSTAP